VPPHELLHRLNNQLGVILAHAELIEQRARTEDERARASQVVQAALQAMAVSRELREHTSRESETLPFGTKVQN
jgi:two-component sensor histidine kinase